MRTSVQLENLTLSYHRHPAVHHVSGCFESGSLTAITGPNGAGKTALLKGIAGLLKPQQGRIVISSGATIAYLPQIAQIEPDFPLSVLQAVTIGLWDKIGNTGAISPLLRDKAQQALSLVGLAGFSERAIASLSVGQFQRMMFARVIAQDASLILLDEPFAALDVNTVARLLELMASWHSEGRTIICVMHNYEQIKAHFPSCLLLAREPIGWGEAKAVLAEESIAKAHLFHEAWQTSSEICAR